MDFLEISSLNAFVFLGTTYKIATLFIIITSTILLYPAFQYIIIGWKVNKDTIVHGISDESKFIYLHRIHKMATITQETASTEFDRFYNKLYGRRRFLFSIVHLIITIIIIGSLVAESILNLDGYIWKPILSLNLTATAALAGAYMWVTNEFISRARRLDFSPSDVQSGSLRLIIAVALGLSFGSIIKNEMGAFIAFALGAFPLGTIQVALRQLSNKQLGLELGATSTNELLH